jgi:hypothetical protein
LFRAWVKSNQIFQKTDSKEFLDPANPNTGNHVDAADLAIENQASGSGWSSTSSCQIAASFHTPDTKPDPYCLRLNLWVFLTGNFE